MVVWWLPVFLKRFPSITKTRPREMQEDLQSSLHRDLNVVGMGCQGNDATRRRKSMPVRLIFTSSTLHLLVHLKLMMLMRWYEMLWPSEAAVAGMGIGDRREGGTVYLIAEYSLFYIDDTVWSSWSSSCCKLLLLWLLVLHLQTVANQQLRRWNFTLRHTFLPNERRRRRRPGARCHLWRGWEGDEQWASKCTVALINLHSFAEINYMHKYTLFLIDYSRPMTKTACRYHSVVGDGWQHMWLCTVLYADLSIDPVGRFLLLLLLLEVVIVLLELLTVQIVASVVVLVWYLRQ